MSDLKDSILTFKDQPIHYENVVDLDELSDMCVHKSSENIDYLIEQMITHFSHEGYPIDTWTKKKKNYDPTFRTRGINSIYTDTVINCEKSNNMIDINKMGLSPNNVSLKKNQTDKIHCQSIKKQIENYTSSINNSYQLIIKDFVSTKDLLTEAGKKLLKILCDKFIDRYVSIMKIQNESKETEISHKDQFGNDKEMLKVYKSHYSAYKRLQNLITVLVSKSQRSINSLRLNYSKNSPQKTRKRNFEEKIYSSASDTNENKKRKNTRLHPKSKQILTEYFKRYLYTPNGPYPSKSDKISLSKETNLSFHQVQNFFGNARRKYKEKFINNNMYRPNWIN
ncbi:homeobox protein transcription factor [Anaeramoeba flamelloides]|uniref:Homeobox protein transcription factor n=1 Tax=Anaeramoeba flamelloides TaxID=1746091 RepID=A0AAV7YKX3_9EUKA|nr:homeobox protein transcription factor [Anaeramoeba flamelloides]